jgi:hypothetical protein
VEVVGADHGGDVRPAGSDGLRALFLCRRRTRRLAGPGGPKGRMGLLAATPIGPKVEGKIVLE